VLDQVVGLGGKAYAERAVLQGGNLGQNVGVGAELQVRRGLLGRLLDLDVAGIADVPVRYRCNADKNIGIIHLGHDSGVHLTGGFSTLMRRTW